MFIQFPLLWIHSVNSHPGLFAVTVDPTWPQQWIHFCVGFFLNQNCILYSVEILFYRSGLLHLVSVLKILLIDGLKHICLKGVHILQIINYSVAQMPTVSVRYVEDVWAALTRPEMNHTEWCTAKGISQGAGGSQWKSIDTILGCAFGKFGELRSENKARENRKIPTEFHQYLSDRTHPSIGHNSTIRSENLRSKPGIKAKAWKATVTWLRC